MIPECMRFYSYTSTEVLNEYARTFFSLINSMYEITAKEMLNDIIVQSAAQSEDGKNTVNALKRQKRGLSAIIEEVKVAKGIKK